MQQESRVGNASRNMVFGILLKGYQMLLPFIIRTVIMAYMGLGYLGLNSLFGSVLWVLCLAELGVGSAMVYSMYQPIIDHDTKQICALLNLYKKYYRIISIIIAVIGLTITPAIPYLVKSDMPEDANIYIVYLLNLASTVLSYMLFAYRQSILVAHQRNDIVSKVRLITNTFMYASQIFIIIFLKDYYLYLIAAIVQQILTNCIVAYVASKKYPDYKAKGTLAPEIIKKINGRIKDLVLTKIGTVIVSSSDSIVISAFLGLSVLAVYNNYYYILYSVMLIVGVLFDSCMSGIGNSILTDSKDKIYKDLNTLTFIVVWVTGFCATCLICLYQPFMALWAGEDNLLAFSVVVCLVIYFYVDQINRLFITYKDAAGIWHQDRFRPLITALVNLTMNIILVQFIGVYGVVLSTVLSVLFVGIPWILHNLFTTLFFREMKQYVISLITYTLVVAFIVAITCLAVSFIKLYGAVGLIVKAVVCVILANVLLYIAFGRTTAFADTKLIVKRILKRG